MAGGGGSSATASGTTIKERLRIIRNLHENLNCVDCNDIKPTWATLLVPPNDAPEGSATIGAFCCFHCSGIHRSLGTHICFVRSVTLDEWKEKEIVAMELGGNRMVNQIFEASPINEADKISAKSEMSVRKEFIQRKYVERKYYQAAEYRNSPKIEQDIVVTSSKQKNQPVNISNISSVENPFPKKKKSVTSDVAVVKEPISDEDFFKSLSIDWEDPFRVTKNEIPKTSQRKLRAKKSDDCLSRSWHPESPTKTSKRAPSRTASNILPGRSGSSGSKTKGQPKSCTDMLMEQNQEKDPDEDDTILDSVGTSLLATNSIREASGRRRDTLSVSCHPSISSSNALRSRELCSSRHRKTSHDFPKNDEKQSRHTTRRDASFREKVPTASRPKLQRRLSTTEMTGEEGTRSTEKKPMKQKSSPDLIVAALVDYIQATTDVTDEEIQSIMKSCHMDKSSPTDTREIESNDSNDKRESDISEKEQSRTGRVQRSASFSRRMGGERKSRSSSRNRTHSRSRRAVLSRQNSVDNVLDGENLNDFPSLTKNRNQSLDRKSRARQAAESRRDISDSRHSEKNSIGESNTNPRSSRHKAGSFRETNKLLRTASGRMKGRSRRTESGHHDATKGDGISGRHGRVSTHGEVRKNFRSSGSNHTASSRSSRPEKGQEMNHLTTSKQSGSLHSFSSQSVSTAVSEASDIDDEEDLLIL